MDGWMDEMQFYVLFNSIQSYQDSARVVIKASVQWNLAYGWKGFHFKWGLNWGPLDQ